LFTEAVHDLSKFPTDDDVPRHKRTPMYYFVREQAKRQLPPLPLLIRDEDDPLSISLGGKGLGDLNMLPVVAVIDQLPIVESIDFSDNRMTDVSLMPLAEKLVFMTSLTHLDLSFNKIDESAETIIEYLQGKKCKLKTLVLNGAGMYD
jgi:Leucine-rich repeat (LRR) protein